MRRPNWFLRLVVIGYQLGIFLVLAPIFALLTRDWLSKRSRQDAGQYMVGARATVSAVLESGWGHIRIGDAWHLAAPAGERDLSVGDDVAVVGVNGAILIVQHIVPPAAE